MSVGSSRTLDCLHSRTFSVVLFPNYLLKLNKKFEKYSISVPCINRSASVPLVSAACFFGATRLGKAVSRHMATLRAG